MNKLNVAYKQIAVYKEGEIEYVFSNLSEYDIHPWYAPATPQYFEELGIQPGLNLEDVDDQEIHYRLGYLSSQRLDWHLLNDEYAFNNLSLKDALESGENFIYPFVIYNNWIFERYNTIDLDDSIVEALQQGRCKIVFSQVTEGFYGQNDTGEHAWFEYKWLDRLAKKYNIAKNNIAIMSANLKTPEIYDKLVEENIIDDTFTIIPYSHFNDNLWFSRNGCVSVKEHRDILVEQFYQNLKEESRKQKTHHFLCFNRVPKNHRALIYTELNSHPQLIGKSISSLGGLKMLYDPTHIPTDDDRLAYYHWLNPLVHSNYKHDKRRILKFLKDYDSFEHSIYDAPDMENNYASNINIKAHNQTFLNIVTESLTDKSCIFFSEKTFKPMFAAQPFIIVGNPHSLKKLKELGYKTFDAWWDESYDSEEDLIRRVEKIVDVLLEIASWDLEKCNQVAKEMEPILLHNFEVLISGQNTMNALKQLSQF